MADMMRIIFVLGGIWCLHVSKAEPGVLRESVILKTKFRESQPSQIGFAYNTRPRSDTNIEYKKISLLPFLKYESASDKNRKRKAEKDSFPDTKPFIRPIPTFEDNLNPEFYIPNRFSISYRNRTTTTPLPTTRRTTFSTTTTEAYFKPSPSQLEELFNKLSTPYKRHTTPQPEKYRQLPSIEKNNPRPIQRTRIKDNDDNEPEPYLSKRRKENEEEYSNSKEKPDWQKLKQLQSENDRQRKRNPDLGLNSNEEKRPVRNWKELRRSELENSNHDKKRPESRVTPSEEIKAPWSRRPESLRDRNIERSRNTRPSDDNSKRNNQRDREVERNKLPNPTFQHINEDNNSHLSARQRNRNNESKNKNKGPYTPDMPRQRPREHDHNVKEEKERKSILRDSQSPQIFSNSFLPKTEGEPNSADGLDNIDIPPALRALLRSLEGKSPFSSPGQANPVDQEPKQVQKSIPSRPVVKVRPRGMYGMQRQPHVNPNTPGFAGDSSTPIPSQIYTPPTIEYYPPSPRMHLPKSNDYISDTVEDYIRFDEFGRETAVANTRIVSRDEIQEEKNRLTSVDRYEKEMKRNENEKGYEKEMDKQYGSGGEFSSSSPQQNFNKIVNPSAANSKNHKSYQRVEYPLPPPQHSVPVNRYSQGEGFRFRDTEFESSLFKGGGDHSLAFEHKQKFRDDSPSQLHNFKGETISTQPSDYKVPSAFSPVETNRDRYMDDRNWGSSKGLSSGFKTVVKMSGSSSRQPTRHQSQNSRQDYDEVLSYGEESYPEAPSAVPNIIRQSFSASLEPSLGHSDKDISKYAAGTYVSSANPNSPLALYENITRKTQNRPLRQGSANRRGQMPLNENRRSVFAKNSENEVYVQKSEPLVYADSAWTPDINVKKPPLRPEEEILAALTRLGPRKEVNSQDVRTIREETVTIPRGQILINSDSPPLSRQQISSGVSEESNNYQLTGTTERSRELLKILEQMNQDEDLYQLIKDNGEIFFEQSGGKGNGPDDVIIRAPIRQYAVGSISGNQDREGDSLLDNAQFQLQESQRSIPSRQYSLDEINAPLLQPLDEDLFRNQGNGDIPQVSLKNTEELPLIFRESVELPVEEIEVLQPVEIQRLPTRQFVVNDQTRENQPSRQYILNRKTPETELARQYSLNEQILARQPTRQYVLNEETPGEQLTRQYTLNEQILERQPTRQYALNEKTPGEQLTRQYTLNEQILERQPTRQYALNEQTPGIQPTRQYILNERTPGEQLTRQYILNEPLPDKQLTRQYILNGEIPENQLTRQYVLNENNPEQLIRENQNGGAADAVTEERGLRPTKQYLLQVDSETEKLSGGRLIEIIDSSVRSIPNRQYTINSPQEESDINQSQSQIDQSMKDIKEGPLFENLKTNKDETPGRQYAVNTNTPNEAPNDLQKTQLTQQSYATDKDNEAKTLRNQYSINNNNSPSKQNKEPSPNNNQKNNFSSESIPGKTSSGSTETEPSEQNNDPPSPELSRQYKLNEDESLSEQYRVKSDKSKPMMIDTLIPTRQYLLNQDNKNEQKDVESSNLLQPSRQISINNAESKSNSESSQLTNQPSRGYKTGEIIQKEQSEVISSQSIKSDTNNLNEEPAKELTRQYKVNQDNSLTRQYSVSDGEKNLLTLSRQYSLNSTDVQVDIGQKDSDDQFVFFPRPDPPKLEVSSDVRLSESKTTNLNDNNFGLTNKDPEIPLHPVKEIVIVTPRPEKGLIRTEEPSFIYVEKKVRPDRVILESLKGSGSPYQEKNSPSSTLIRLPNLDYIDGPVTLVLHDIKDSGNQIGNTDIQTYAPYFNKEPEYVTSSTPSYFSRVYFSPVPSYPSFTSERKVSTPLPISQWQPFNGPVTPPPPRKAALPRPPIKTPVGLPLTQKKIKPSPLLHQTHHKAKILPGKHPHPRPVKAYKPPKYGYPKPVKHKSFSEVPISAPITWNSGPKWKGTVMSSAVVKAPKLTKMVDLFSPNLIRSSRTPSKDSGLKAPDFIKKIKPRTSEEEEGFPIIKLRIPIPVNYTADGKSIIGKPGADYPAYDQVPQTPFTCQGPGHKLVADNFARCQVFHKCEGATKIGSFICPHGTVFDQQSGICDWWYDVTCHVSN
ncbi:uncharacterized protein LOC136030534 [Artemia franciscana]|uniref:Chitin-binding type-2 domain-containing protein n=1 Tax=Artemia franciscana TaxID=6661 RepID=A0AA88KW87_ARTSF|nr:hypothetical protein QYM36_016235 [Artemia franciscana]